MFRREATRVAASEVVPERFRAIVINTNGPATPSIPITASTAPPKAIVIPVTPQLGEANWSNVTLPARTTGAMTIRNRLSPGALARVRTPSGESTTFRSPSSELMAAIATTRITIAISAQAGSRRSSGEAARPCTGSKETSSGSGKDATKPSSTPMLWTRVLSATARFLTRRAESPRSRSVESRSSRLRAESRAEDVPKVTSGMRSSPRSTTARTR